MAKSRNSMPMPDTASFPNLVCSGSPWPGPVLSAEDAHGPDVLACWLFKPGAETEDHSGREHALTLQGGARVVADERFGACLEPGAPTRHEAAGAMTASHPGLSPPGPFTLDLWIHPDPSLENRDTAYLVDKMSIPENHRDMRVECLCDYLLLLERAGAACHRVLMHLGFARAGGLSTYTSEPVQFRPGVWSHIAFVYDGRGQGRIHINGRLSGEQRFRTRRSVVPGTRGVMIGDRGEGRPASFPGRIGPVRLLSREEPFLSGRVEIRETTLRRNFLRMERDAAIGFVVLNATESPLRGAAVTFAVDGCRSDPFSLPELMPGERHDLRCPVDASLRAGEYRIQAVLSHDQHREMREVPVRVVGRDLPGRMPMVGWVRHQPAWGSFNTVTRRMKELGFTHRLDWPGGMFEGMVFQAGAPVPDIPEEFLRRADDALGLQMKICLHPVWTPPPAPKIIQFFDNGRFNRIDRHGTPRDHFNACGLFPELQAFSYNIGASIAQAYHSYPAWNAVLPQSEQRDGAWPCFHAHCREAYRAHSNKDIPSEVVDRFGVDFRSLRDFPRSRIVSDTHPILAYYEWFWRDGDGWNGLHSRIHDGAKSTGRKDVWTWFDPAVRSLSRWGSGGKVDVISQWTYTYPNPEAIGFAADELFAMAEGRPGQQVMKMTQIIWYRSQTAPEIINEHKADWEQQYPDSSTARWITISPAHLSQAFWTKLSRPIQGIMYHGLGSLLPMDPEDMPGSYVYTHAGAQEVLRDLSRRVVEPLGPTLVQVPDPPSEVAFLQSFTSQVFTRGGTFGWCGGWPRFSTSWAADSYLALRVAQIQPRIVYEESLLERGLDGFTVLVMTDCEVVSESVAKAVRAFQRRGGIVVGDEHLAPGLMADVEMRSYTRSLRGDRSREQLLEWAAWIRTHLDPYLQRLSDSDNPDVLTRVRRYGKTDYLFAYNDNRTFGTYVGHHGLVMEDGVPSTARVKVRRGRGHVYDLLDGREIPAQPDAGWLQIRCDLAGGEGRLWMVTDNPISGVRLQVPKRVTRGERFRVDVSVTDPEGKNLDAVIPVRIDISDARGERMEFSGEYGAKDGQLRIEYDTASNDDPGPWVVRCTERASGKTSEATLCVE